MSERALTISVPIGEDAAPTLQIKGRDGKPATGLLNTDTPSAMVWAGADQAVLFSPSCAWVSAALGTVKVTIAAAQTAALEPGSYALRVAVARGSVTIPAVEAWLELTASPGSAAAPAVYGTAAGVREHLAQGDRLEAKSGLAAFLRERGKAREWLDSIILMKVPRGRFAGIDPHHAALGNWAGPGLGRSRVVKQYLDANKLLKTHEILEAVNRYAAHLVLKPLLGNKPDDPVRTRCNQLLIEAHSWLASAVAEIDTNGDGFGEWNIPLGIGNTRYA